MTSDHLPIYGTVPSQIPSYPITQGWIHLPRDKLSHFAHVTSQWLPSVLALQSVEVTENLKQELCSELKEAAQAVNKRTSRRKGKSVP